MYQSEVEKCYDCKHFSCNIHDEDAPCFRCIVSTENGVVRRNFEKEGKDEN